MDVDGDVGPRDVADHGGGERFGELAVLIPGKRPVQIDVEHWNAALDGVDAERVHGRVDVDRPGEQLGACLQAPGKLEGDVLPFELVAVHAGDDCKATSRTFLVVPQPDDAVLLYGQVLAYGQLGRKYGFNHEMLLERYCSLPTMTLTSCSWRAPPRNTPDSMGQSVKSRPWEIAM